MPSRYTFSIKPIAQLLQEEGALGLMKQGLWFDPFAGKYSPADFTNDKDPEANAQDHIDALQWLKIQSTGGQMAYYMTLRIRLDKHKNMEVKDFLNKTIGPNVKMKLNVF